MLVLLLLLLDAIFDARKTYRELTVLLRLGRGQLRRKEHRKLAKTVALSVIACGPLYMFIEVINRL